jgi:hypothetical protein
MQLSPTRSISRSNSRGSNRSFSASTPNLQRPNYRPLDTIPSVASGHEVLPRSRSRSQDLGTRISRIEGREIDLTMRSERRVMTDPSSSRPTGKRRKGETAAERGGSNGRPQDLGNANVEGDKGKRRGVRCIVM